VYYAHLGDMQGARQCEELTNESVMLNQMAKSKFAPPQPNKPIRDVQDWKQIRNILLEQQNWELALEVIRNCLLRTAGKKSITTMVDRKQIRQA